MSLVGAAWSAELYGALTGIGFMGSRLQDFCDAVGNGSVTHIVGKPFTTTDSGLTPGAGPSPGSGVGIVGIDDSLASTTMFATALGHFGQFGSRLQDACDAIASVLTAHMAANATLTSTHTPVYSGVGIVDVGSIGVVGAGWGSDIQAAAPSFIGSQWGNFANAIGVGCEAGVLASGTGTVTISGSFGGSAPPGPVPGAGVGAGTIS